MTATNEQPETTIRAEVDVATANLAQELNEPLLIMFYPNNAFIEMEDVGLLYWHLREHGLTPSKPLTNLNVVLHTVGGDAHAAYRLAQLLRDFATNITFIVPEYAYSGGTSITLAGNKITLAHCAVLSPIDVGLSLIDETIDDSDSDTADDRLEPVAVDHYIEMATKVKVDIEAALQNRGIADAGSSADEALMTAMVENPENAMRIGTYYRQRNIAQKYANQLLKSYMLNGSSPSKIQKVIDGLVTEAPDHQLVLDYHLCSEIGLAVYEAKQDLSDLSKKLVSALQRAATANVICRRASSNAPNRPPFFRYTGQPDVTTQPGGQNHDEHDAHPPTGGQA